MFLYRVAVSSALAFPTCQVFAQAPASRPKPTFKAADERTLADASMDTTYEIFDAKNVKVAESHKQQFGAPKIDIIAADHPDDASVRIRRGAFQLGFFDEWVFETYGGTLDPRVYLMIPAFKTDRDATL